MPESTICLTCGTKICGEAKPGKLGVCDRFVAYYNDGESLKKCETDFPHRHIVENLRHSLDPILALMMEQLVALDPSISPNTIDTGKPLHKILASIVILDQFVAMLSGADGLHPKLAEAGHGDCHSLKGMLEKYFALHSVIHTHGRLGPLNLTLDVPDEVLLHRYPKIYESIISVLLDNIWRHSLPDSEVIARLDIPHRGTGTLTVTSLSKPIPIYCDLFSKGGKAYSQSDGFDFGLYWATILKNYYNALCHKGDHPLQLTHSQRMLSERAAVQEFCLSNMDLG
jgi:hypothetical protein